MISSELEEIVEGSDRVSVLRDGETAADWHGETRASSIVMAPWPMGMGATADGRCTIRDRGDASSPQGSTRVDSAATARWSACALSI